jgi:hypothetical protein
MNLYDYIKSIGLNAVMIPVAVSGDEIIGVIESDIKDKDGISNPELAAIADGTAEDDNPILCFFKLKDLHK